MGEATGDKHSTLYYMAEMSSEDPIKSHGRKKPRWSLEAQSDWSKTNNPADQEPTPLYKPPQEKVSSK